MANLYSYRDMATPIIKVEPYIISRDVRRFAIVLCIMLALWVHPDAHAQTPIDTTRYEHSSRATLTGWVDRLHIALRDRQHAHGGMFYDRGLLRRLTSSMDHEYALDLRTYGFTLADDADWYDAPQAFRTYMGSIHRSRFATASHFRSCVALGERHTVTLTGLQQEDLEAERFFVEVGYRYQRGHHQLGFRQTIASYKPDLDLGLFYAFEGASVGQIRMEMTLMDVANNFIFNTLGVDAALEDTVRSYRRSPRLLTMQWKSPTWHGLRGEIHAGVQPNAHAEIHTQTMPDQRFTWQDRVHFIGVLLEAQLGGITVGAMYRETGTGIMRSAPPGAAFTSTQASRTTTLYGLARLWKFDAEVWIDHERYRDHQFGTDFDQAVLPVAMDYREVRTTVHTRLVYVPPDRGLRFAFDYLLDSRTYNDDVRLMNQYLRFPHHTPNGRLALQVGYAFSRRAYIVLGAAYDAGGDPFYGDRGLTRYDGGFARVVVIG